MRLRRLLGSAGRPLNFTVRSRVEEFTFAPWMAARARWLRVYRAIANAFLSLIAVILLLNLLRLALPQGSDAFLGIILLPLALAVYPFAVVWFLVALGFLFGLIRCPSCAARFASRLAFIWAPRNCQNCGFDIYTLRHATSNNRWSGP